MNQKSNEFTGGMVNYYLVKVDHPQRETTKPYVAECEDLIEALDLTFNEANIFKEIFRTARARQGTSKKGHTELYAAEKILHYAKRIHKKALINSKE